MIAELISVGTEILLGNITNTNAAYLSQQCALLGLDVYYEISVGDNEERLGEAIKTALSRSDVVILSGGLGPTQDDLTKEVTAGILKKKLVEDALVKASIEKYFECRKINKVVHNNWKQAEIIENSIVLENRNGTAPGLITETEDGKRVILLPGPPDELIPLFKDQVAPYLSKLQPHILYSKMVKICGIGESVVETQIKDLIDTQTNPTIAPYAKTGEVHLRVTAGAKTAEEAKKLIKPVVKELKQRFGDNIYSIEEKETLEEAVIRLLKKNNLTLVTAESCTGGLLTGRLLNVPGASEILGEGFITYSNKAKRKLLDVSKSTLKKYGAVSEKTAKEMAKGAAIGSDCDTAVAVTGIAGPDGGSEEKPVGLVYIACYVNEQITVKEYHFFGSRQQIRNASVVAAMDLLRHSIIANYTAKQL